MKRSEINRILKSSEDFFTSQNWRLPVWGYWTWDEWLARSALELDEILTQEMGWDITDFALGDFERKGMVLFTVRNGSTPATGYDKPYCEKLMIVNDGQLCLTHFHWDKVEDIINRGGGTLNLRLNNANVDESLDMANPVVVYVDGIRRVLDPGAVLSLAPGESVTLPQRNYHSFWGTGRVLIGEVSKVNDDHTDNRFLDDSPRFPKIDEDEPIFRPLVGDYAKLRTLLSC